MAALVYNRKARFNYEIVETYEAGVELLGYETKAIKAGLGSLDAAYVIIRGGEAFIIGSHIPPYQTANTPLGYDPDRNRRLLLTKKEIHELAEKEAVKGLAIVVLSLYNKGRRIKAEIAVGKGKKLFDKRETIKKRETDRDIRRTLKGE